MSFHPYHIKKEINTLSIYAQRELLLFKGLKGN